jgi:hypothetical protein
MSQSTVVSQGTIEDRAVKLANDPPEKPAEKPSETPSEKPAEKPEETPGAAPSETPEAKAAKAKPTIGEPDKKTSNDPEEMRKWNTRVSMELSEMRKRFEELTEVLNRTQKKQVDWKELAKDPAKLQEALEAERSEWDQKFNDAQFESTKEITQLENERRKHDPTYPRWVELQPVILDLAAKADSRINFNQHPRKALDQLYELALEIADKDPNFKRPQAPSAGLKTYTEEELHQKLEEARAEARASAQKGIGAEEAAAGVGGMGKGAPKGKGGVDKEALWSMPLGSLKQALIKASS